MSVVEDKIKVAADHQKITRPRGGDPSIQAQFKI